MKEMGLRVGAADAPIVLASLGIAALAFRQATIDMRYQLADLADPFLGRPAPGWSIGIGILLTLVGGSVLLAFSKLRRPDDSPNAADRRSPWRWAAVLLVGWIAYAAGGASIALGSGSPTYGGTVRLEFGTPLESTADVPVSCRLVVGDPDAVAVVTPQALDVPMIDLRNAATGATFAWASPAPAIASHGSAARPSFTPPGVPERPAPYLKVTSPDGTVRTDPPLSFLGAYDYQVLEVTEEGLSGSARIQGTRFSDPYGGSGLEYVNLEMPNDPWPPTFELTMRWTCTRPPSARS
jgi:hypothetical protein